MTCDDRRLLLRSVAVTALSQSHGTRTAAAAAAAAVASSGLTGISSHRRRQWRRREFAIASPMRLSFLFLACVTLMACRPCQAAPHVDSIQQQRHQRDIDDEDGLNAVTDTVQLPAGPLQHVVSVVKGKTDLPCDIGPPLDDDQPSLVLFYKDDASPSIYTYDARDKYAHKPRHWSDDQVLGKRAYFNTVQQPAALSIDNVRESDAGLYRCRVDFRRSPTRNSRVNLTVVVPPKQIRITDEKGVEVDQVIGPFDEDSTLILVCIVTGGNPTPEVTWWQEQRMVDKHSEFRHPEQGVRNVLQLERLSRSDLLTSLSCQAANTQLSLPLTRSVQIELNLKPLDVRILSSRQPLSSGKKYELACRSTGSRPPPVITWWKDGQLLRRSQETQLFDGGNVTLSQLDVTLTPEDDGKKLVCRAENAHLGPASAVEDSWMLDVYYVPRVRLELGRNLEGDHIREGIDVYFDCHVVARPNAVRLVWRHQGNVLQHNVSAGVIISETSLVLQRVSRHATGRYTCHASNAEGEGSSLPYQLNVAHKPVCRSDQKSAYGGAKGLSSEIECHVESKPGATSFRWAFNGTGELVELTSGYRTTADGSISVLRYTPRSELDFGTLLCWASNPLGTQQQPCVYHFYAAGVPDPPNNCSIANQTTSSFEIDCSEGYDGGIPQHFKMHVFDIKTRTLIANLTSSSPRFALHVGSAAGGGSSSGNGEMPLPPPPPPPLSSETPRTHSWKASNNNANSIFILEDGSMVDGKTSRRHSAANSNNNLFGSIAVIPAVGTLLQVTAVNAHGASDSVFIEATGDAVVALLPAEMQASGGGAGRLAGFEFTPTLAILTGIISTGAVMMIALIAGFRLRWAKKASSSSANANAASASNGTHKEKDCIDNEYMELGTKDPDVITQDKGDFEMMAHITNNPLDFMTVAVASSSSAASTANGRMSNTSTLPLRDSDTPSPSIGRSSQEEIVYAELTLSRQQQQQKQQQQQQHNLSVVKSPLLSVGGNDAVVYAQIDHNKRRIKRKIDPPTPPRLPNVVPSNNSSCSITDGLIRETTLF